MSGYESAPATILIAVYCACCGKELLDAKSVETGMGPHCRAKHGFRKPDAEPDWTAVIAAVELARHADPLLALEIDVTDARVTANRIVHRVASLQVGPAVPHLVLAIAHLGFAKLSERIGSRVGQVHVETREDGRRELRCGYVDGMSYDLRRIGGDFKRDPDKFWLIPAGDVAGARLLDVLAKYFPPGTIVRGSKRTLILQQRAA